MRWRNVSRLLVPFFLAGNITACGDSDDSDSDKTRSLEDASHFLSKNISQTDSRGEATLDNLLAVVKDKERHSPLSGVTVYFLDDGEQFLSFVVDESGRYKPGLPQTSTSQHALAEEGVVEQPLVGELLFVLTTISAGISLYKSSRESRGTLLDDKGNVNRYCMTLEQMTNYYVNVPAGILFLSADTAGYGEEMIKIATNFPLNKLFENHIKEKYGEHKGYEVRVPKTIWSVCGEEYDDIICPITTETLSKRIWEHADVPVWEIKGSCDLENREEMIEEVSVYGNEPGSNNETRPSNDYNPSPALPPQTSCEIPSCVQYGEYSCDSPCVKVENKCIDSCVTDFDCKNNLGCYYFPSGHAGCFLIPCGEGCPTSTTCINLEEEEDHLTTSSGAEVLAASRSLNVCLPNECKSKKY